jgi:hypothetical protein
MNVQYADLIHALISPSSSPCFIYIYISDYNLNNHFKNDS